MPSPQRLHQDGDLTKVLDGDNIRNGLNRDLGFSDGERRENIRRIAEASKLFLDTGIITINAFTTPKRGLRHLAREVIGPQGTFEARVKRSHEKCLDRNVQGLYAKADSGALRELTGKGSVFEPPDRADLVIDTEKETEKENVDRSLEELYRFVIERIRLGETS